MEEFKRGANSSKFGRCLTIEELGAWLDDTLSPEKRALAERHVNRCQRCSMESQLIKAYLAEMPDEGSRPARRIQAVRTLIGGRYSRSDTRKVKAIGKDSIVAIAAGLFVTVILIVVPITSDPSSLQPVRPEAGESTFRGASIRFIPAGENTTEDRVSWLPVEGADQYMVTVLDGLDVPIHCRQTTQCEYSVSSVDLSMQDVFFLKVTALDKDGNTLTESSRLDLRKAASQGLRKRR